MDSKQFKAAAFSSIEESKVWLDPRRTCGQLENITNYPPVAKYYDTVEERRVVSNVEPGYLRKLLPESAPQDGEDWSSIQADIEAKIMPGMTHWWA
jgi:aromatic-L-amino-acid/L-tryptophan decarboxylase